VRRLRLSPPGGSNWQFEPRVLSRELTLSMYTTRDKEETDVNHEIIVADVLDGPRESNYLTMVRSVAPAVLIILEKDAPARIDFLRTTEAEEDDLTEWAHRDELARRVLDAYLGDDDDDSERWKREEDYTLRMASPVVTVGA
jgi:hypothetical protein